MKFKKTFAVLVIVLVIISLAGCGTKKDPATAEPKMRIVTDIWGREVKIPAKITSIVCLGPGAPRLAAYLGVMDMIAGAEKSDAENFTVLRDYNPIYHDALKKLPIIGAGGGSGNNNAFPEELIKLSPDVILASYTHQAADELFAQTKIPVIAVRYISNNFIDNSFYRAVRVFADVVGKEERAEEILSFIDAHKQDLHFRTSCVPKDEKLTVYAGAVTFNGRRGFAGTYAKFGPLMGINALNVADEVNEAGFFEADLEKIIVWNPQVIFLDPGSIDLVNGEYNANPDYFKSLRAVEANKVYTLPSFNNNATNATYALMNAYYAGTVLFPEQFKDIDIALKSDEILTFLLGKNTFDIMAEKGLYYGNITLGK
jgi:iron complex transport system substrate-binding protein